jgi:hypothetical protein
MKMKELFMKLLWFFKDDNIEIRAISMRDGGKYSDIDVVYKGKKMNITIRDDGEDEEDA